jgi:hypothetical protein
LGKQDASVGAVGRCGVGSKDDREWKVTA